MVIIMPFNKKELRFKGEHGRHKFCSDQIAVKVIDLIITEIDVSPMVINKL
jgi:hypothetical protein